MAATGMRTYIDLPAAPVAEGGVLAVANVVPVSGHPLLGVDSETDACTLGGTWEEWCSVTPVGTKTFPAGLAATEGGDPFVVYGAATCDLIRIDVAEQRARDRLRYNERRLVDAHVIALLDSLGEALPGTVGVVAAMAALEANGTATSGSELTLLMPVAHLTYACARGNLRPDLDGTLRTCQGTKVAGYATTTGTKHFITGQITLLQGPVQTYSAPPMANTAGVWQPARAIAERIYVPVIECFVYESTVDPTLCDCGA